MDLIPIHTFKSLSGIQNTFLAQSAMKLMGLHKVNSIYHECYHDQQEIFLDRIKTQLDLQLDFDVQILNHIPKTGPFITISNHPFGTIDGIILIDLIQSIRPDFKVMGNYLLTEIKPITKSIIEVDPFAKGATTSLSGIKSAMTHLKDGQPLGIFPAGEVSSWAGLGKGVQDKPWENSIIKFIKKSKVPVIPVYFHGQNSWVFNSLGMVHPLLRTIQLPRESLNKKHPISVRMGKPISVKWQNRFNSTQDFKGFLRAKTYVLGTELQSKHLFKKKLIYQKPKEILTETPKDLIIYDLVKIPSNDKLFSSGNFDCYCTPIDHIPNILREIGRLREITFREVGEGTNKPVDLDQYDLYYQHLFVWDRENQKIVGAYRVGNGEKIMTDYGKSGFYINSLFKISNELIPLLTASTELGRSFIVSEYQKSSRALFILWKGILAYSLKVENSQYLIGPVSISGRYNKVSKMLISDFVRKNYYNEEIAQYITPRKRFRFIPSFTKTNFDTLKSETLEDLDKVIEDIEPSQVKLPVLLKKYLQQKAKIVGFNRDPKFNNALDGFIVLKLSDLDLNFVKSLSREMDDEKLLKRFQMSEKNES